MSKEQGSQEERNQRALAILLDVSESLDEEIRASTPKGDELTAAKADHAENPPDTGIAQKDGDIQTTSLESEKNSCTDDNSDLVSENKSTTNNEICVITPDLSSDKLVSDLGDANEKGTAQLKTKDNDPETASANKNTVSKVLGDQTTEIGDDPNTLFKNEATISIDPKNENVETDNQGTASSSSSNIEQTNQAESKESNSDADKKETKEYEKISESDIKEVTISRESDSKSIPIAKENETLSNSEIPETNLDDSKIENSENDVTTDIDDAIDEILNKSLGEDIFNEIEELLALGALESGDEMEKQEEDIIKFDKKLVILLPKMSSNIQEKHALAQYGKLGNKEDSSDIKTNEIKEESVPIEEKVHKQNEKEEAVPKDEIIDIIDQTNPEKEAENKTTEAAIDTQETNLKSAKKKMGNVRHLVSRCYCEVCSQLFSDPRKYWNHRYLNHDNHEFGCTLCDRKFKKVSSLIHHTRFKHVSSLTLPPTVSNKQDAIFFCESCGEGFVNVHSRLSHIQKFHSDKYILCNCCHQSFSNIDDLVFHAKRHQIYKDNNYSCNICNRTIFFLSDYLRHVKSHNLQVQTKFKCQNCKFETTNLIIYKRHLVSHKKFNCACLRKFLFEKALKLHKRKYHTKKRIFNGSYAFNNYVKGRRLYTLRILNQKNQRYVYTLSKINAKYQLDPYEIMDSKATRLVKRNAYKNAFKTLMKKLETVKSPKGKKILYIKLTPIDKNKLKKKRTTIKRRVQNIIPSGCADTKDTIYSHDGTHQTLLETEVVLLDDTKKVEQSNDVVTVKPLRGIEIPQVANTPEPTKSVKELHVVAPKVLESGGTFKMPTAPAPKRTKDKISRPGPKSKKQDVIAKEELKYEPGKTTTNDQGEQKTTELGSYKIPKKDKTRPVDAKDQSRSKTTIITGDAKHLKATKESAQPKLTRKSRFEPMPETKTTSDEKKPADSKVQQNSGSGQIPTIIQKVVQSPNKKPAGPQKDVPQLNPKIPVWNNPRGPSPFGPQQFQAGPNQQFGNNMAWDTAAQNLAQTFCGPCPEMMGGPRFPPFRGPFQGRPPPFGPRFGPRFGPFGGRPGNFSGPHNMMMGPHMMGPNSGPQMMGPNSGPMMGPPQQFDMGPQQFEMGPPQQFDMGPPQFDMGPPQQFDMGLPQQFDMGTPQQFDMGPPQQFDSSFFEDVFIEKVTQKTKKPKKHICTGCKKEFPSPKILDLHSIFCTKVPNHENEHLVCPVCAQVFDKRTVLKQHMFILHSKIFSKFNLILGVDLSEKHKCKNCAQTFNTKADKDAHEQTHVFLDAFNAVKAKQEKVTISAPPKLSTPGTSTVTSTKKPPNAPKIIKRGTSSTITEVLQSTASTMTKEQLAESAKKALQAIQTPAFRKKLEQQKKQLKINLQYLKEKKGRTTVTSAPVKTINVNPVTGVPKKEVRNVPSTSKSFKPKIEFFPATRHTTTAVIVPPVKIQSSHDSHSHDSRSGSPKVRRRSVSPRSKGKSSVHRRSRSRSKSPKNRRRSRSVSPKNKEKLNRRSRSREKVKPRRRSTSRDRPSSNASRDRFDRSHDKHHSPKTGDRKESSSPLGSRTSSSTSRDRVDRSHDRNRSPKRSDKNKSVSPPRSWPKPKLNPKDASYRCTKCAMLFSNFRDFTNHNETHEGSEEEEESYLSLMDCPPPPSILYGGYGNSSASTTRADPYSCVVCLQTFRTLQIKDEHICSGPF